MQNEEEPGNEDFEIDPDVWLRATLTMMGDRERRTEMIGKICEKTGQTPEKVELIISSLIKFLAEESRSN